MTNSDLSIQLDTLERKFNSITEVPKDPHSTMHVIEYGLGKQQRAEVYVNRLLRYLLDPDNPHRMDEDFLKAFLNGLPNELDFDEDTYDLSNVRVDDQVTIEYENSAKYPDLVIDISGEWFLMIELKFSAEETGTEAYAKASKIRDEWIADFESGQYYLYIHQQDKPTASSDEFANVSWESVITDILDPLITNNANRYPQRTVSQLHELKDDLKSITNMDDEQTPDQEKIELYLEHVDAIEDVQSTFDSAWSEYSERWGSKLAECLTENTSIGVRSDFGNKSPEVLLQRSDDREERWIFRDIGGDWQHMHKYGWYKHEETLESLTGRAENNKDLRIGFYHRMGKHRDDAVHDHKLRFKFRNMGSNPSDFKDIYSSKFDQRKGEIETLLSGTKGTLTGNKLTKFVAVYDIPVHDSEGFFEAYTSALENAFTEFVVENPELIRVLDETLDDAIEEFN